MNKCRYFLCLAIAVCLGNPALATALPPDFTATYRVQKYSTNIAQMRLALRSNATTVSYSSHSKPRGLAALLSNEEISETSELLVRDSSQPLQLIRYQYQQKDRAKRNQQFSIEYASDNNARIQGSYGKNSFQLETTTTVWDRLSVQLALIYDVATTATPAQQYRYAIIDKGGINEYVFEFTGETVVKIGNRSYQTLGFKRQHGKRTTYLWLAKDLHYLPVKIDQHKGSDLYLSMSLEQISL